MDRSPQGVTSYVGLLRQSPNDDDAYELYLGLDMRSHLRIQKADVVHWENLSPEKSPFGSLGGCRVLVRKGARITSVRTATSTFESGASDDFDLDIRLGARASAGTGGGNQTIPETGCGTDCDTIPPFSDPDAGCKTVPATFCGCTAAVHDRYVPLRADARRQDVRRQLPVHAIVHLHVPHAVLRHLPDQLWDVQYQLRHVRDPVRDVRDTLRHVPREHVQHEVRTGDLRGVHPYLYAVQPARVRSGMTSGR